ncbi:hypothetical protein SAMN05421542_1102 [Chryseobacterium jejuense]|uniref:Uncharacterized protein n=1 Tax=Chryseobacterium jejuense TaxID=445960 RepID=A0ABY0PKG6_CHRJE|nr:hypothetical protein SAMN05421542_1102 [Chryseobacterium jejuense]
MSLFKKIFDLSREKVDFKQIKDLGLWLLQIISFISLFNYLLVIIVLINKIYKMILIIYSYTTKFPT